MILGNRGQRVCRRVFRHESSLRPISAMPRGPKGDGQTRRVSSVTHRAPGLLFPIEIGADIGTSLAAGLADEIAAPDRTAEVIRPFVRAHGRPMATAIIRTVDPKSANARGSHLAKGDLFLAGKACRHQSPVRRGESNLLCRLGLERGGLPRLAVVENVAGTTAKIVGYLDWVGSWLSGLHGTRPSPPGPCPRR